MKIRALLVLSTLFLAPTTINARAADVVGTWRLSSVSNEETESKVAHKPFGDHPVGSITYTADGHMMVIFADSNRKPPVAPRATDGEAVELYRTMVAYAGTYSVDGNKVTHKIDVSWNQAWNGTNQTRFIEVKDDQWTITTAPFVSPFLNKQVVSTLAFDRVK
jgi:transposase-like protein